MPVLGDLVIKLGVNMDALDDLGSQIGSKLSSAGRTLESVSKKFTSVGLKLSATFTAPLVLAGRQVVNTAARMDALERGLGAVMKSGTLAADEIERLREVAKLPGLGLAEAIEGSTRLQAVGFSAERARDILLQFGNAIAMTGGGRAELAGVITQLTQMSAKGKVLMQDLRPIMERMPIIGRIMQEAFGTIDPQALDAMGISADEFLTVMLEKLAELPRVTGGLANALENFGDSVFVSLGRVGDAAAPLVEAFSNRVAPAIEGLAERFAAMDPTLQRAVFLFAGVLAAAGPIALAIGALLSPVGLAAAAIAALAAGAYVLIQNWDAVRGFFEDKFPGAMDKLGTVFDALSGIVSAAMDGVRGVLEASFASFMEILNVFSAAWQGDWGGLWDAVAEHAKNSLERTWDGLVWFAETLGGWTDALQQHLNEKRMKLLGIHPEDIAGPLSRAGGAGVPAILGASPLIKDQLDAMTASYVEFGKVAEETATKTAHRPIVDPKALEKAAQKAAALKEAFAEMNRERFAFEKTPAELLDPALLFSPTGKMLPGSPGLEGFDPTRLAGAFVPSSMLQGMGPMPETLARLSQEMMNQVGVAITWGEALEGVLTSVAETFGAGIWGMIEGSQSFTGMLGSLFGSMLSSLGDWLIKIGMAAVAASKVGQGLRAAIMAPGIALAAGLAAIAVGAMLKGAGASLSKASAGGGAMGGGSMKFGSSSNLGGDQALWGTGRGFNRGRNAAQAGLASAVLPSGSILFSVDESIRRSARFGQELK